MRPPAHPLLLASGGLLLAALILLGSCTPTTPPQPAMPPPPTPASAPAPDEPPPAGPTTLSIAGKARQGGLMRGIAPGGTRTLTLDGDPVALDGEGNFIIAFDRDAAPQATLVATLADGQRQTRTLDVAPGNWRIERIDAAMTGSATSEQFRQRRAGELTQINAARSRALESDGWRQSFIWPVKARISGLFGAQRIYRGTPASYHSGLDLAGGAGTVYVAPADGVVTLAAQAPFTLEGNLLMIDHGMGLNSAFLHSARLLVKEGDRVRQGQPIGIIGATGRATGPHLHWSMKWRGARIDPLLLLPEAAP